MPKSSITETQKRYGLSRTLLHQELQEGADQFVRKNRNSLRIKVLHDLSYQYTYPSGSEHLVRAYTKEYEEKKKRFYSEHFLLLEKGALRPDYASLQQWQAPFLTGLYRSLEGEARKGRMSEREFVTLLARFVQHLKYRIPPDKVDGVETLGFWPPVMCLKEQGGACDSKSTLFASLFTHYRRDACVLILTKRHAFIGIKDQHKVFPRDRTCRIAGREYLLVEMTNPSDIGKIDPKQMKFLTSGKFSYLDFH